MRRFVFVLCLGLALAALQAAAAHACDVNAGPIWNQQDAEQKCPGTCTGAGYTSWNGQWKTTVPGKMSVCGCVVVKDVDAGPIWNQADANKKCPGVCQNAGATWNGQWTTTVPGKMSVCGCSNASCLPKAG
jgi:mannan-binding protein